MQAIPVYSIKPPAALSDDLKYVGGHRNFGNIETILEKFQQDFIEFVLYFTQIIF
jgi:hypothetical protein